MTLDEQRMHPDRRCGFRELEGAIGSSARLFSRSWELCGVGDIEADRRRAEGGELGAVEFHHVRDPDEVVDESVVSEEGAALGEHEVVASRFGCFADWSSHLAWGEELSFFDVNPAALCRRGLCGRDDEVGLSAQERGNLDQIHDSRDCLRLLRRVDIGGGGDPEFLFDRLEVFESLLDPDAPLGVDRGAIRFVEARFEDEGESERFAD